MSIRKKTKDYRGYLIIAVILGVIILGGGSALQSGYSVGNVWDADVQIKSVGYGGSTYQYSQIANYEKRTPNSVIVDPDGNPTRDGVVADKNMGCAGLDPSIEWNVGSLFHVDKYGDPTSNAHPKDDYTENGVRYLVYYFGFSYSLITRSNHPDVSAITGFDFYGQTLKLFELPEFAQTTVSGEVGIVISNVWNDVPSQCGVEQIKVKNTRTYYTMAAAGGYPSDISEFNYQYDWLKYSEEGYISDPDLSFSYPGFAQAYQGVAKLDDLTMRPGGEYAPVTDVWGTWTGGSFNVWDVEIIMDMYCKVVISYELSADVNGYLAQRLDIGWPTNPVYGDFWTLFIQFFTDIFMAIAKLLGLNDPLVGALVLIGGIVGLAIIWKLVSRRRAIMIYR